MTVACVVKYQCACLSAAAPAGSPPTLELDSTTVSDKNCDDFDVLKDMHARAKNKDTASTCF